MTKIQQLYDLVQQLYVSFEKIKHPLAREHYLLIENTVLPMLEDMLPRAYDLEGNPLYDEWLYNMEQGLLCQQKDLEMLSN